MATKLKLRQINSQSSEYDQSNPPYALDAEQAVLSSLLIDNKAYDYVSDILSCDDFYRRDHRLIFQCIQNLSEEAHPFDKVTITNELRKIGEFDSISSDELINDLIGKATGSANIVNHAAIIKETSVLRTIIHTGSNLCNSAINPGEKTAYEILEAAEQNLFQIAENKNKQKGGFKKIQTVLRSTIDKIEELFENGSGITGISTSFTDLDKATTGLQDGDLIIIAGRPSMGKTSVVMNMVEHTVVHQNKGVAVFSLEMPAESLSMRMLSSLGRIDQNKVRTGQISDEEWPRMTVAINALADAPLYIDDTPALTVPDIRTRLRRLIREHGSIGMVVIDYLQLMQSVNNNENRVQQISEISRGLKSVAKEFGVPVIALSQLNRNLEQRPNKRPLMSDLRESGAIEQDADLILFVYRDEVYYPDTKEPNIAEIIIGKQRNGPLGTVKLYFVGKYTRFENYEANPFDSYES